jgi:CubicO group peptidase (beta-lactamase class C family)
VLAQSAPAGAITAQVASHIDAAVTTALVRQHVASASLAIVKNGVIVYAKGYGVREIASGAKADAQTVFPIGSNTKQFTAASILQLQERGLLNINDLVVKYVPDAPHASEITIKELLEQVSGLPDYTQTPEYSTRFSQEVTPEQMLATIRKAPLGFKPGTDWQYSNTNYLLLSMIISKASGESYHSYISRALLKPLTLSTAAFDSYVQTYSDEAHGYTSFAMGALHDAAHNDYSWFQGAGDLMMSATDLARWDIALDSGNVISPASFAEMSTPKTLPNGKTTGYGYGLSAGNRFLGHLIVGHLGGLAGFVSENLTFPSERVAVVLLGNSDTFDPVPLAHDIVATIYGQQLPHRISKVLTETKDEEAQARAWLGRAFTGTIANTDVTAGFMAWMMPTQAAQASVETDLKALGDRLGAPQALRLISRDGPPGVHAFEYHVTFANDVIDFQYALSPSGRLDYLNFAPVYDY